ncbi:MAG: hypothetical protein EBU82_13890, partial [Flavobacteriia bacterium]|nr:hypothetical protein [Flavobacteriia bacterium]
MSAQPGKAKKSTAPKYELQVNESGAMSRALIGTTGPTPPPPRRAIVTAAVTSSAAAARRPPPPPEEENIVFGDEGEILTGEAR